MNRLFMLSIALSLTVVSLNSCGGAGARAGGKAAQQLVKNFSKNAGKNSQRLLKYNKGVKTAVTQDGRLVPLNQMNRYKKIAVPNANSIGVMRSAGSASGSPVAQSSVQGAKVDLLLYDAVGNPIVYADDVQQAMVYTVAKGRYKSKVTPIVDDVLQKVQSGNLSSDAELKRLINTTVDQHLGSSAAKNPFIMDVSSGNLTFNMEFQSGSQIVGSINIYDVVKKGVAVGSGGYYVVKRLQ